MPDVQPTLPTELYDSIPKDFYENLEWRVKLRKWAMGNKDAQEVLLEACRKDIFFWLGAFCWLFEPRAQKEKSVLPFIPWPHQTPALGTMHAVYHSEEQGDIGVEKARGEGASWLVLMLFLHDFIFSVTPRTFGLVSRNMDMADNPEDMSSLMTKITWQMSKLPTWMTGVEGRDWKYMSSANSVRNLITQSAIKAYACTGDLAAGGRTTAFLMDEFGRFPRGVDHDSLSAVEPVTDCRFLVSTYDGPHGAYYNMMQDENSSMTKIIMRWEDNPTRNRGLYKLDEDGRPEAIDTENNPLPTEYRDKFADEIGRKLKERGFNLDGVRSPWFDARCLRPGMTPRMISREYERDPGGAAARFFVPQVIDRLIKTCADEPIHTGELEFDNQDWSTVRFIPSKSGRIKLWMPLTIDDRPLPDKFVLGADVATGVAGEMSSNSTATVCRGTTGEKVLEFASPSILPHEHADLCIAICHWLKDPDGLPAYMIWEDMGPGKQFKVRVLDTDFRHFYMHYDIDRKTKQRTQKPGWTSARNAKAALLSHYRTALTEERFINKSREALRECKFYIYGDGDRILHVAEDEASDPSGAKGNHGDRVIGDALCAWVLKDWGTISQSRKKSLPVPANCYKARQLARQAAERQRQRGSYWN